MMSADPDFYIRKKLAKSKQGLSFFDEAALAEYMRCFRNPATDRMRCARITARHSASICGDGHEGL